MSFFSIENSINIGNFIGCFIRVDEQNFSMEWNPYMRIRVSINLNMPLKRKMFLQTDKGESFCVKFRHEKLPSFCFACGVIGHAERFCPHYPNGIDKSGGFRFGPELRASKGIMYGGGNKWLVPVDKGKGRDEEEVFGMVSPDADRRPQQEKDFAQTGDKVEQKHRCVDHEDQEAAHKGMDVEKSTTKNGEGAGYNARLSGK
ncbi:unnamed protein product [Cuscuta europaea]|uniref:CCHC-type domain-containing protein n=1 Tax=Cuscuta europaea TaxID=41803 RepID=A0A9P0YLR6_CUSEU|nr:unnamed protein product [Cuscuta europaea]